ncbi:hypothetical protein [Aureispira sp. CCB-QB1]|uniref:hypothetical protein n=1 Tax=Aureispira sp. CCB-QB1 TaxID=1313421 RepID=UPI000695CA4F|nr:hypothetical protein [Aureispira sp. CCB-QB1]
MTEPLEKIAVVQKVQRSKLKASKRKLIKKEIRLQADELSAFQKAAKLHKKRITVFIKQAALAYIQGVYILPDDSQIKHFERSLRQVSDAIHHIAQKGQDFTADQFQEIQDLITILETSLHRIFHQPQKLETLLEEMVQNHPHLHTWVKERLEIIEKRMSP